MVYCEFVRSDPYIHDAYATRTGGLFAGPYRYVEDGLLDLKVGTSAATKIPTLCQVIFDINQQSSAEDD